MIGAPPGEATQRDWLGVGCSALCVLHCGTPLLFAVFGGSVAGVALFNGEWVHSMLLVVVPGIALWSLLPSFRRHGKRTPLLLAGVGMPLLAVAMVFGGNTEAVLSIAGALVMMAAHAMNRRLLVAVAAVSQEP